MTLNTEEFLQQTTDQTLDEFLEPCPAGEYVAIAGRPSIASFVYKKGEHTGETGYRMVIRWEIQDDEVKRQLDRDTVSVSQSILLDLTPDGQGLDMGKGKNVSLGQLRGALGQNKPGETWNPGMIEGQPAKLKIKAGVYNDRVTAEVDAVTAA